MPFVTRIVLFPIKALDGVSVAKARISPGGTLEHDRNFALFDREGRYVNGKANPDVHRLRSSFNFEKREVTFGRQGSEEHYRFRVDRDRDALEAWLGEFFGFPVRFAYRPPRGFPDDPDAFGPTVISQATLVEIAAWFPEVGREELSRRFRANIEIDGVPAFWEDRLFDEPGTMVDFTIGSVRFEGINPCQRCVVPSRDSQTGEIHRDFQKIFATRRQATLPAWAKRSRFNHFYRLAVNTRIPASETGKEIHLKDPVEILGIRSAPVSEG